MSELELQAEKALNALRLEVDESIATAVKQKVMAAIADLKAENKVLRLAIIKYFYLKKLTPDVSQATRQLADEAGLEFFPENQTWGFKEDK